MKERTKAWMDFSSRDMEAARKLIDDEYLSNIAIFHSQQCVEKCLKAILEEHGQDVPRIHGVNKLYFLITKKTNVTLPVSEDELDEIDDVYIDTRYPGGIALLPAGFPEKEDAVRILTIAVKIFNEVSKILS